MIDRKEGRWASGTRELIAASALGLAFASMRTASAGAEAGGEDWTSRALLGVLALAVLHLTCVLIAWRRSGTGDAAAQASTFVSRKLSDSRRHSGQSVLGHFPRCAALKVSEAEAQWFEEVVARVYNADFVADEAPVEYVQQLDDFFGMLSSVMGVGHAGDASDSQGLLHEPVDAVSVARILIATDFDVAKASHYLANYMAWRQSFGGPVAPPSPWLQSGVVRIPFQDRFGRPVLIVRACLHRPIQPGQQSAEIFEKGYQATLDAVTAHCMAHRGHGISKSNPLEQYVVLLDMRGVGWNNFSLPTLKLMKHESDFHYAERLAQVYVIFPNSLTQVMWSMAAPLLHPRTKRKVQMIPQEKVPDFLCRLVGDPDLLPPEYGGTGPALPLPGSSRTLEDMGGALAAKAWRILGVVSTSDPEASSDIDDGFAVASAWACCGGCRPKR